MWCESFRGTLEILSMRTGVRGLTIRQFGRPRMTMGCGMLKLLSTPIQVMRGGYPNPDQEVSRRIKDLEIPSQGFGGFNRSKAIGKIKPPPNWQEIVAAHEDERVAPSEPREEFQIPILGVSDDDAESKAREKLNRYGGGPADSEVKDYSTPDAKQGAQPAKTSVDTVVASVPYSDGYHMGITSQRLSNAIQKTGQRSTQKWKGPDKISKIYGDWIDDLE
ncbi:hypothetical protein DH2020_002176 [Rehmannia glutinosa]|uniref:Uncharacterized protein n=1 Tax=Rehmannia glutinosa TaxID=99300 RepID=A0ABR0XTL0_REHGL